MSFKFTTDQRMWARRMEARSKCRISPLLHWAYRFSPLRRYCLSVAMRLEGGRFFSTTLREILKTYHSLTVGKYSYGPCIVSASLPPGTVVGAYCSIAAELKVFRQNHPIERLTQHPFFYNSALGLLEADSIAPEEDNPLYIGSDVWIGERVLVLPGCKRIGHGAVVGAGSVVTEDVADFSIVIGTPARKIRDRFPVEIRQAISDTNWWEHPLEKLMESDEFMVSAVQEEQLRSFCSKL